MALASQRIEEADSHACGMLAPRQQKLLEPVPALLEDAVHAWESGEPAEAAGSLCRAVSAAGDLEYL
jgi:hypothetical protein